MSNIKLYNADCFDIFPLIQDKSIDAIICDLPYGRTACKWDSILPFDKLWNEYKRIIKDNGAIVLFGSEPFSSLLRVSNLDWYRYDLIWEKSRATGFLEANNKPMKKHENISIFGFGKCSNGCKIRLNYNPQGIKTINKLTKRTKRGENLGERNNQSNEYIRKFTNYPNSIIKTIDSQKDKLHPTQKPLELIEYLVKTYSNEKELIFDNCMGSGTTGLACKNLNRNFIGIEKDEKYYNIALNRINNEA